MTEPAPILLASDDHDSDSRLVNDLRSHGGYAVEVASTLDALVDRLQATNAGVVLLGCRLDGQPAAEVCAHLRNLPDDPFVPIVLLADRVTEDVHEALDSGADDYILTSYDREDLLARVYANHRGLSGEGSREPRAQLHQMLDNAGNAIHQLNQPLTVVQGYLELLQAYLVDEPAAHKRYDRLRQAIVRINEIVREMAVIKRYRAHRQFSAGSGAAEPRDDG